MERKELEKLEKTLRDTLKTIDIHTETYKQAYFGLDFGWTDASAAIRCYIQDDNLEAIKIAFNSGFLIEGLLAISTKNVFLSFPLFLKKNR